MKRLQEVLHHFYYFDIIFKIATDWEASMDRKIRILGILPYEGMKPLMASLEEEFPSVDLTLFVGDMEKGLEIAKNNFH